MDYPVPTGRPTRIPALEEAGRAGGLQKAIDVLDSLDESYVSQDLRFSLFLAVAYGHVHVARYLFDRGATVGGGLVASGAIRSEAERDLIPVLKFLLEHGWDVNEGLSGAKTALCCEPVLTNEAAVKWLLDHGASPNMGPCVVFQIGREVVSDSGMALQLAACSSSISTLDLLLEHGAKLENSFPLHDAAGTGDERIPMMAHLIELGVDVNGLDTARVRYRSGTPLHCAVGGRHIGILRLLLENGADPNIEDVHGLTPIEAAKKKSGNQEIITLLEKAPTLGREIRSEQGNPIIHNTTSYN